MSDFTLITGTIRVESCSETMEIIEQLRVLVEGMDERDIICTKVTEEEAEEEGYESDTLVEVAVNIYGYTPATRAQEIDDKIRELGPYAVEVGRFATGWACDHDYFFVGIEEQVAWVESRDALEHILSIAPKLEEGDAGTALQAVLRQSRMPAFKKTYFAASGIICPFCDSADIQSGALEVDGMIAWAEVECVACKHIWQDVWTMIDITEVRDADGHDVVSEPDARLAARRRRARADPGKEVV
ncbi:MAG: hypothetical protein KAX19_02395 [Candidatus Brocadiae bacterium]|nr:hypothetical protein [Candidatus Brocadiia bacterium]